MLWSDAVVHHGRKRDVKTVYVAGPMRGFPRYNFDAFESAEQSLAARGFNVISPHRLDLQVGFNPDQSLDANGFSIEDAVRRDVEAMIASDALVLLPGWEQSIGANAERGIALWLGKPVYLLEEICKNNSIPGLSETRT
jgi:nucleoside 2-deoxyribosyltransferase